MKIDDILKKCIEIPGISIKSSETSTELLFKSTSGKGTMTSTLFFRVLTWHIFLLILPYGLHRISMKMAPMQQDLFYSIIVLQDAVKLSLITETMFILKTMICLSRNILLKVNISIPGTFMKGWNFLLILQRSQMKTHGYCGNLALTFIKL